MNSISVNLSKSTGELIKPMHSVNNGPVYKFAADQRITNIDAYRAAGIPLARNHDASFNSTYGGEHIVDVNFIFRDFDADPTDPASYDFTLTDEYLRVIEFAGTKNYYRIGSKIEHWQKKYNTLPPKDFKKWAVICEHIIRHYTEGWADGFKMDIEYWEIWNEPDLDPDDSTHKRCWGGTKAEFFDLYEVAAKHLKSCFPHLKIGGPAFALRHRTAFSDKFLARVKQDGIPLDFFSYHAYVQYPDAMRESTFERAEQLADHGLSGTETILNEYNYIKGWMGDDWNYSLKAERSLHGASFVAGCMCACQESPLDMLMYYDARPSGMNGIFDMMTLKPLKGYYVFKMFSELYALGTHVETGHRTGNIYHVAATDGKDFACMLTHYPNNETDETDGSVKIEFTGAPKGAKVEYYLLDETHDCELISEEIFTSDTFAVYRTFPLHATYLIKITAL